MTRRAGLRRSGLRRAGLRQLMLGTSALIALAFLGVGGGLLEAIAQLDFDARSEVRASSTIQQVSDLESSAIQANRTPQVEGVWRQPDARLEAMLREARAQNDDLSAVQRHYAEMKRNLDPVVIGADETAFLDATRAFRARKWAELQQLVRRGDELETRARLWALWLSCVSVIALAWSMMQLWRRVFDPIVTLAHAARRFGEGDLATRAQLPGNDELSELGATFDAMASLIQERENERLRFVAGVAHDLKNPLVVIGGAAGLIRGKFERFSPETRDEWLGKIESNAKRMNAIIADLTDAVQSQTATLQLNPGPNDLTALSRDAVDEAGLAFPAHAFVLEAPESLCLPCDGPRVQRVLDNLLSNAAKYSPPGKIVTLRVQRDGDQARCEVEDEGGGIALEDAARLFQPFVRLDGTRHMASGTGLGLVSVQKVVRAHGGDVWLESEVGRGSKFGFWLPVHSNP